jgi:hypothetical protein
MKKIKQLIIITSLILSTACFGSEHEEGWDHLMHPCGDKLPRNDIHKYSNPFTYEQVCFMTEETGMDLDNLVAFAMFSSKSAEAISAEAIRKNRKRALEELTSTLEKTGELSDRNFVYCSTYIAPRLMAAWAKKIAGTFEKNGVGRFLAGIGPEIGESQKKFIELYPNIPEFMGDMEITELAARADPKLVSKLMFNMTTKAFLALETNLGPLSDEEKDGVQLLRSSEVTQLNLSGNIHIILASAHNTECFNLHPKDTIYCMGGTYRRGVTPETLGYNTAAGTDHFQKLLDHADECGRPIRIVNSDFCDLFKCRAHFWVTLAKNLDNLSLSHQQKAFLEHAIYWQVYLSDRLAIGLNIDIVERDRKSPIFSDPITWLIAFSEMFPELGPKLYGEFYKYKGCRMKLNKLERHTGGYMGTKNSDGGWKQNPSSFFEITEDEDKPNVLITVPAGEVTDEMRLEFSKFAEQGILDGLNFSEDQRSILLGMLNANAPA